MVTIGYSTRSTKPEFKDYLVKSSGFKKIEVIEKVNNGEKSLAEVYNEIISESKTARTPKNKGFSNVLLKLFLVVVVTFVCLIVYKNLQIKSEIAIKKQI